MLRLLRQIKTRSQTKNESAASVWNDHSGCRFVLLNTTPIKIRFNIEIADDMNAYNAVKGADGQNAFIKEAILYYAENGKDEALAERIADLIFEKMKSLPPTAISVPPQQEEQNDFSESADIADAFLDSL